MTALPHPHNSAFYDDTIRIGNAFVLCAIEWLAETNQYIINIDKQATSTSRSTLSKMNTVQSRPSHMKYRLLLVLLLPFFGRE